MSRDAWLVVGGAGYVGGHTVARLHASGRPMVVLDDLSSGLAERIPDGVPLIKASMHDRATLARAMVEHGVTGVMHFAALKSVPESVADPVRYYHENIGGIVSLLTAMSDVGVARIVYSSSAAVYGIPPTPVVTEQTPTVPINPYGQTKLIGEQLLRAAGDAHGLSWLALRYFNAVGADDPTLADRGVSNLFPLAFEAFRAGRPVSVTGGDFDTPDGTGIRDYVHVADIADAHMAAAERLERAPGRADGRSAGSRVAHVYNIGTGRGHSVLEVLAALESAIGQPVPYRIDPRRPGDPAQVIAAVGRIRDELGWFATRDLPEMVRSAWVSRHGLELR
jgi:UDP-glucose 4-epimerase